MIGIKSWPLHPVVLRSLRVTQNTAQHLFELFSFLEPLEWLKLLTSALDMTNFLYANKYSPVNHHGCSYEDTRKISNMLSTCHKCSFSLNMRATDWVVFKHVAAEEALPEASLITQFLSFRVYFFATRNFDELVLLLYLHFVRWLKVWEAVHAR